MSRTTYLIIFILLLATIGCRSKDASQPATNANASDSPAATVSPVPAATTPTVSTPTVKNKTDVCALITGADLKIVQGAEPTDIKRSDTQDAGFIVTQCYYSLPMTSNSVVLNVTAAGESAGARDPREYWQETFASKKENEPQRERDREREGKQKEGEGEAERAVAPQKISGLGDDAYWIANRVGGALYVLRKDSFFRISVGGAGDANAKLKKSKALAQKVLKRF